MQRERGKERKTRRNVKDTRIGVGTSGIPWKSNALPSLMYLDSDSSSTARQTTLGLV